MSLNLIMKKLLHEYENQFYLLIFLLDNILILLSHYKIDFFSFDIHLK